MKINYYFIHDISVKSAVICGIICKSLICSNQKYLYLYSYLLNIIFNNIKKFFDLHYLCPGKNISKTTGFEGIIIILLLLLFA